MFDMSKKFKIDIERKLNPFEKIWLRGYIQGFIKGNIHSHMYNILIQILTSKFSNNISINLKKELNNCSIDTFEKILIRIDKINCENDLIEVINNIYNSKT